MLASTTLFMFIIMCLVCVVMALLGFCFTSREPAKPQLHIKATRIQVFTDNSVTKKLSKSLTKSSQRPVLPDTHISADSTTARSSQTKRRAHWLASPTLSSNTISPSAESQPSGSNLQLGQTFKMGNRSPIQRVLIVVKSGEVYGYNQIVKIVQFSDIIRICSQYLIQESFYCFKVLNSSELVKKETFCFYISLHLQEKLVIIINSTECKMTHVTIW